MRLGALAVVTRGQGSRHQRPGREVADLPWPRLLRKLPGPTDDVPVPEVNAVEVAGGTEVGTRSLETSLMDRQRCTPSPPLTVDEQERLTNYAVEARYPGDCEEIRLAEAKKAVALARKVRLWARRQLPRAAIRKK